MTKVRIKSIDLAIKVAKAIGGLDINTINHIGEKFFRYATVDTFQAERLKAIDTAIKLYKDRLPMEEDITSALNGIFDIADTLIEFYTDGEALKERSRYMFEQEV